VCDRDTLDHPRFGAHGRRGLQSRRSHPFKLSPQKTVRLSIDLFESHSVADVPFLNFSEKPYSQPEIT